jgi:hypothetical protein
MADTPMQTGFEWGPAGARVGRSSSKVLCKFGVPEGKKMLVEGYLQISELTVRRNSRKVAA